MFSNKSSGQLYVVAGGRLKFPHGGLTLFDHVEKHLWKLRVFVQIHQVGKTIVHFERHSCFLRPHK